MSTSPTVFRLAVFMLLAMPVAQCQTGVPNPATDDKAAAAAKEADAKKAAAEKAGNASAPGTATTKTDPTTINDAVHVLVLAVAKDQLSLDVTTAASTACQVDSKCNVIHLIANDSAIKDQLKQLHKGDHIQVVYSTDEGRNSMKAFCADTVSLGWLSIT